MSGKFRPDGEIRRSQVLTTGGAGALVDLVTEAVVIKGPDHWRYRHSDEGFLEEPRLQRKVLRSLRKGAGWKRGGVRLRQPPACDNDNPHPSRGISSRVFPKWYLCRRCNSLVQRGALTESGRHECYVSMGKHKPAPVVPIRFVNACPRGHLQDIHWRGFVHSFDRDPAAEKPFMCCKDSDARERESVGKKGVEDLLIADLQLSMQGTSGELSDLWLSCRRCGARRNLNNLTQPRVFGKCNGWRPWMDTNDASCDEHARFLIRTGSNAWFPVQISALDIPNADSHERHLVATHFDKLRLCNTADDLRTMSKLVPGLRELLDGCDLDVVARLVRAANSGEDTKAPSLREAEWATFMAAEPGLAHDLPPPEKKWAASMLTDMDLPPFLDRVVVVQVLRELRSMVGFTRLDSVSTGAEGEPDESMTMAPLSEKVDWVPTVEIKGEGIFLAFKESALREWEGRKAVQVREQQFRVGMQKDNALRGGDAPVPFTSARLIMLHSLAHMLITAISVECGYPAAAIRERIYCYQAPVSEDATQAERDEAWAGSRAGILLYTGTPGSEGTLGGLVELGPDILRHLRRAAEHGTLCSNDPVCSQHGPDGLEEGRRREGAACHGCLLIAEPSCERRNVDLDRALVVPTVESAAAAFLGEWLGSGGQ